MKRDPILSFTLVVASLMVYATLYPFHFVSQHSPYLDWGFANSRANWLDAVLNLYFFMPLGLLLGVRFRSKNQFLLSLAGSCLLSLSVELAQAYLPGRSSSLRDVLVNTMGAFLGLCLAHLPIFDPGRMGVGLEKILARRGELALALLYLIIQFSPFFPVFRLIRLRVAAETFGALEWAGYASFENFLFSLFVSALLPVGMAKKHKLWLLSLLLIAIPGQIFVGARALEIGQTAGAMLGIGLSIYLVACNVEWNPKVLAWVAVGALAFRQLQPFHWQAITVHSFGWVPLSALFENPRESALRLLALKCFLYWFVMRQCSIAFGIARMRTTVALAGFLLVTEIGQLYQIERTPEITDPLLALIGALPFLCLMPRKQEADQGL